MAKYILVNHPKFQVVYELMKVHKGFNILKNWPIIFWSDHHLVPGQVFGSSSAPCDGTIIILDTNDFLAKLQNARIVSRPGPG